MNYIYFYIAVGYLRFSAFRLDRTIDFLLEFILFETTNFSASYLGVSSLLASSYIFDKLTSFKLLF